MARLDEDASIETMLDYSAQVSAGLGSLDVLAPLVHPWKLLTTELRTERDARDNSLPGVRP